MLFYSFTDHHHLRHKSYDSLTPQVLDKVFELHLPLWFDIGAVHVRVEEDDSEGQDKDGVWILELPD